MCIKTGFLILFIILPFGLVSTKLVPLHRHDGYARCLQEHCHKAVYCVAKTYIKPDDNAPAWHDIVTHNSRGMEHFRHDSVLRSYCVNDCVSRVNALNDTTGLTIPKFDIDPWLYKPAPQVDKTTALHRQKYATVINQCANIEMHKYGLQSYSEIDFCMVQEEINDPDRPWDPLDLLFLAFMAVIVTCLFVSTYYDNTLPTADNPEHYEKHPVGASKTMLAFSIKRNWAAFTNTTPSNNNADDFDFFEGLRVLVMSLNTIIHTIGALASISLANPEEYEQMSYGVFYKIFAGGTFTNQIYFTFAGFLLTFSIVKDIKKGKVLKLSDLWDALKRRYMRLTPVMAFVILLEVTMVRKLYTGPVWTQLAGYDESYCRSNWWTNLLYINNFVRIEQICMLHTWYLSTDMQLFVVRFFILALISRYPQLKKKIFAIALILTYLIPAYVTYVNNFHPIMSGDVEMLRQFFRSDSQFQKFHVPMHTNAGSYLIGMITAFIYHEIKERKYDVRQSKLFMSLWYLHYPILFVLLSTSYFYFTYNFEKPSIYLALYSAIYKNAWGILVGTTIIGYNAGMGGWMKEFLGCNFFKVFGRANYAFYLMHMTVLKFIVGNAIEPFYFSKSCLIVLVFNIEAFTYFFAGVVYVTLELPAANLQKIWMSNRPKPVQKIELNNNDNNNVKSNGVVVNGKKDS